MSDNINIFWSKVLPECVSCFEWGKGMEEVNGESEWKKSLKKTVGGLDDAEFDVFLAQVVIKASGKGLNGVDLTALVEVLKSLRS